MLPVIDDDAHRFFDSVPLFEPIRAAAGRDSCSTGQWGTEFLRVLAPRRARHRSQFHSAADRAALGMVRPRRGHDNTPEDGRRDIWIDSCHNIYMTVGAVVCLPIFETKAEFPHRTPRIQH